MLLTLNVDFIDNDSTNYQNDNRIQICQYGYDVRHFQKYIIAPNTFIFYKSELKELYCFYYNSKFYLK